MLDKKPYSLLLGENSESDEKLANKLILIAPTIVIILLLILIPNSPVYGWLNKGRYQVGSAEVRNQIRVYDTATGELSIKQVPDFKILPLTEFDLRRAFPRGDGNDTANEDAANEDGDASKLKKLIEKIPR